MKYTSDAIVDLHERTHRSLAKLLDHCAGFSDEELRRELDGFGFPTLLLQLDHMIGAEEYWVGVLHGASSRDEHEHPSIDALRATRERVAGVTSAYLRGATASELNEARSMTTWGEKVVDLVPAHVVLRTQTHIFQHQGQVAAMCRLLGRPLPPGLDVPLG